MKRWIRSLFYVGLEGRIVGAVSIAPNSIFITSLSGLLWEGWVGVRHVCGMRNGWPQVALYGSLERSEPMHGRE